MRKLKVGIMLTVALSMLLLAACSTATPTPAPAQPTQAPAAQPTKAAEVTAAPQATKAASKPFRVGLVTDIGKIDDRGFLQMSWEGLLKAKQELGVEVQYIQTTDPKDYAKNIDQFATAGYDMIVTSGFGLVEATPAAAKKYPNIKFLAIGQAPADPLPPNLVALDFPEDQGGFLAGVLAAMVSKANHIGAVWPTDAVPAVWRYGEGFRAGAKYVKPDIQIDVVYHNDVGFDKTFNDPEWGKTSALAMIDKGVDVIFSGASDTTNGALLACAQKGVLGIGADSDAYLVLPEAKSILLSSAMKMITPDTFAIIKSAVDGTFKSAHVQGHVGLAPFHDQEKSVTPEIKAKLDQVLKGLQDGTLKTNVPPTKPS